MRHRTHFINKALCTVVATGFIGLAHATTGIGAWTDNSAVSQQTASARIQGSDEELTYRVIDGYAIYGGDIVLGKHEDIQNTGIPPLQVNAWTREVDDRTRATQSAAVAEGVTTWPNGVVPYRFGGNYSSAFRQVVRAGMNAIEAQTDIRFVEHSNQSNYVNIIRGSGCWSYVGMTGGAQDLSLGRGCDHEGVVIHEFVHALGHWHEQSREDRDQYVRINWNNIQSGMDSNFRIQREQGIGPYDYSSIMHYDAWAFSNNGQPTISPIRDGVSHRDLGQREGLTNLDVAALNAVYGSPGNGKPELTLRNSEAVIFNTQSYQLVMRLADDQTPVANLQVDARSSNAAVLPDDNIELKAGSQSDERVLELTPNRQAAGTAEVTITVTDQQGLSTNQTFTLTVKDDGETPPCTGCDHLTSSLSEAGDSDVQPNGNYYYSPSAGTHRGWLDAPDNAVFVLDLFYWNGAWWRLVDRASAQDGNRAEVSHDGTSGYYAFVVRSQSGQGDYQLWLQRP